MGKWTKRLLLAAPLSLLAGIVGAPYLSADRFKERIRQDLEQVLRRKVEAQGEARFQLYPRPGVSLSRVVIHELPEWGVEPIAYLDYPESSLDVSLAPFALLLGKVKVTGVRLISPSLNITKTTEGAWTFQALLDHAMGEGRAQGFDLDALVVQGGRLNFKIGNVKSVFYLADTDLRVEADTTNRNRYGITIEGDPARTDRTASSFGRLTGRGMLTLRSGAAESKIDLNLAIDRTPISEVVTALQGRSAGLGGFVASQARLTGPLSAVAIEGRLDLNEAERFRWLFSRAASNRGLGFRGLLDWPGQELKLSTIATDSAPLPVSLRMRATDLFRSPRWGALLAATEAPLASVRALAGEFGIHLPSETPMEGSLNGVLGYSTTFGTRGQAAIAGASVAVPDLPSAKLATARVLVDNRRWSVPATEIRFSEHEAVTVEMSIDSASGVRQVALASAGLPVEQTRPLWKFLGGGEPPFFERCRAGSWAGAIRFEQDKEGAGGWAGELRLTGATCALDGVAEGALVESAQVKLKGTAVNARRMAVRVGRISLEGELDHDGQRRRATRLRLSAAEASAPEIERLLAPTLRRPGGFISRTLGRRAPLPEWLSLRRLDAVLRIGALMAGDLRAEGVEARIAWDGAAIDVAELRAALWRGTAGGRMLITAGGAEPAYRGRFLFANLAVREGHLDAEADWTARGSGGAGLLAALQAQGKFTARGNLLLAADPVVESAAGAFSWLPGAQIQLSNVQVSTEGGDDWQAQGSAGPDGKLVFELTPTGTGRAVRGAGRLW